MVLRNHNQYLSCRPLSEILLKLQTHFLNLIWSKELLIPTLRSDMQFKENTASDKKLNSNSKLQLKSAIKVKISKLQRKNVATSV